MTAYEAREKTEKWKKLYYDEYAISTALRKEIKKLKSNLACTETIISMLTETLAKAGCRDD